MPNGDFTVRGLERLSSVSMDMKQYDEVADAYLRLSGLVTVPARKDEALSGYMKAVVAGGDDGKILAAADEVAARAAGEPAKRQALYAKASVLRRTGRIARRCRFTKGSAATSPLRKGKGAYRVIEAARAAGENARVEELVYAFADRNTPHSYWLGKSFIILGDIYAEAGDAFQARATYQSVVDGYPNATDGVVEEAKARIAAL